MPETSPKPLPLDRTRPAAGLFPTEARWLSPDEDVALGCECANPVLQIERWGQEVQAFPPSQL